MVPAFSPGIISGVTRPAPPSFLLLSSVQFPILKLKKRFFSAVFSSWRPASSRPCVIRFFPEASAMLPGKLFRKSERKDAVTPGRKEVRTAKS
jgi:hypothetical protein